MARQLSFEPPGGDPACTMRRRCRGRNAQHGHEGPSHDCLTMTIAFKPEAAGSIASKFPSANFVPPLCEGSYFDPAPMENALPPHTECAMHRGLQVGRSHGKLCGVAEDQAVTRGASSWRVPALLVAVVAGVSVLYVLGWLNAYDATQRPWIFNGQYPSLVGSDLLARFLDVNLARSGQNLYASVGQGWYPYPPGAIFLFLPITFVPFREAFAAWTQLSIACMAATYLVVLRVTRKGPWLEHIAIATWACVATVLLFSPMDDNLALGQLSTIVLLLMALDVLAVRDRSQGFLVGLATAFKLYPGVVVFYWIWRRQWRPAITASLTFVLVTVGAWLVWPASSPWYYLRLLFSGGTLSVLEEPGLIGRNASVTGFLFRLPVLSHSTAVALGTVASVAIAIVGVWAAVRLDRRGYPVTALVILVCTSVLISPTAWDQYFTFAPLLVFVIMEVGLSSAAGRLAALALACFAFPWVPYLWAFAHPTRGQDVRDLVTYNALFVAALLVMASGVLAARRAPAVEATEGVPESKVSI